MTNATYERHVQSATAPDATQPAATLDTAGQSQPNPSRARSGDDTGAGAEGVPVPRPAAGSYARCAASNPGSIALQHEANATAAAQDGFVIAREPAYRWADDGFPAAIRQRPAFDALVKLIRSGAAPFSRLYVSDESRLSRSDDTGAVRRIRRLLERHGVTVHCATVEGAVDEHASVAEALNECLHELTAAREVAARRRSATRSRGRGDS
jgi:hypothetical protein